MKKYPFVILGIGVLILIWLFSFKHSPGSVFLGFLGGSLIIALGLSLFNKKFSAGVFVVSVIGIFFYPYIAHSFWGEPNFGWHMVLFIPTAIISLCCFVIQLALSYR